MSISQKTCDSSTFWLHIYIRRCNYMSSCKLIQTNPLMWSERSIDVARRRFANQATICTRKTGSIYVRTSHFLLVGQKVKNRLWRNWICSSKLEYSCPVQVAVCFYKGRLKNKFLRLSKLLFFFSSIQSLSEKKVKINRSIFFSCDLQFFSSDNEGLLLVLFLLRWIFEANNFPVSNNFSSISMR